MAMLGLLFSGAPARAGALPVADLSVRVDAQGSLRIDQVADPRQADRFTPLARGLAAGYTRQVHWLRFRLSPPEQGSLWLEVQPPYLDDLQLHLPDPSRPGHFIVKQAGDLYPFSRRDIPARGFVFRIEFPDDAPLTAYLRVQTSSTSLAILKAWTPETYAQATEAEYLAFGLYYGLMLAMLLFNLWHGHWRHDPEHRAFLVYALAVLLFMLALNGFVAQYGAPDNPLIGHHWLSAMVIATTGAAAHFHRRVLAIDRTTPVLNAYFLGMIVLAVLCFAAYLSGYFTEAARVLTVAAVLFPVLGIGRTVVLWRQGRAGSLFLSVAYGVSLLSYLLTTLSVQGVLPGVQWHLHSFQGGSLLALMAFNLGLFARLRHLREQRDLALEDARQARAERDAENLARQRQGAMLTMLTHELKTPLSVIRLRLGMATASARLQANAEQAVGEIDGIVERCAIAARLEERGLAPDRMNCQIIDLVCDSILRHDTGARIQLHCPPEGCAPMFTDPVLVRMVIDNLIDNALKYSPADTPIDITLEERPRQGAPGVLITFVNAPGAAGRPDPTALFRKYYRAPGAHGQSGSGLGLYIVQTVAGILGAHIDHLADRTDIVFELWLPHSIS